MKHRAARAEARSYVLVFSTAGVLLACTPGERDSAKVEVCRDPTTVCVLSNGMSLHTDHRPRPLTPTEVKLRDVSVSVTAVGIEASMAGMEMPPVTVALRNTGPSEWSGRLILPVCMQGRSDWQWTLMTRVGSGTQRTRVAIEASAS